MAFFPELKITAQGQSALADAMNGDQLIFVDIVVGSGITAVPWNSLTNLVQPEYNLGILDRERQGIQFFVSALINNYEMVITTDFELREVGVFATINGSVPFLFAYSNMGDESIMVPATGSTHFYEKEFPIYLWIGEALNVTAIITILTFKNFPIIIPMTAWTTSTAYVDYIYQADVLFEITSDDYSMNVILNPASVIVANAAEVLSAGDVIDTTLRVYAKQTPTIDLIGSCLITRRTN